MHVCGYAARREAVSRRWFLGLPVVRYSPTGCCCTGIGYSFHGFVDVFSLEYEVSGIWFYCFFHTLCH